MGNPRSGKPSKSVLMSSRPGENGSRSAIAAFSTPTELFLGSEEQVPMESAGISTHLPPPVITERPAQAWRWNRFAARTAGFVTSF
jgi:hypothetical protein